MRIECILSQWEQIWEICAIQVSINLSHVWIIATLFKQEIYNHFDKMLVKLIEHF